MSKFNVEDFVLESIEGQPIEEADKFVKAHGYTMRVVKNWDIKQGRFNPVVVTRDYKENRINIAVGSNKIHHIEGLG